MDDVLPEEAKVWPEPDPDNRMALDGTPGGPPFTANGEMKRPNLLTLALAHRGREWVDGEEIWLHTSVCLRNHDGFVRLKMTGYPPFVTVFWQHPATRQWHQSADVAADYVRWVRHAKPWLRAQRLGAKR